MLTNDNYSHSCEILCFLLVCSHFWLPVSLSLLPWVKFMQLVPYKSTYILQLANSSFPFYLQALVKIWNYIKNILHHFECLVKELHAFRSLAAHAHCNFLKFSVKSRVKLLFGPTFYRIKRILSTIVVL